MRLKNGKTRQDSYRISAAVERELTPDDTFMSARVDRKAQFLGNLVAILHEADALSDEQVLELLGRDWYEVSTP